jgi:CRISPR-associated protein Cmr6
MVAFWKIAKEKGLLEDTSGREDKIKSLQNRFYGSLVKDDEIVLKYQILFGAQNFKGLLLFLDAYPEVPQDGSLFDLDVMNIHYPKYYSGNEPPGDWQNPNPIFFLTIKEGINFNFHVLFDQYRYTQLSHDYRELINQSQLVSEVKEILEYALKEFGIGAKTRLGYGLFE